jgi:CubicO group peptidase (beta-lactamase class C family)
VTIFKIAVAMWSFGLVGLIKMRAKFIIPLLGVIVLNIQSLLGDAKEKGEALIRKSMTYFIDEAVISGSVTAVASDKKLLSLESCGYSNIASKKTMQDNDLFWIASMTKPMTAVCVMQLHEKGKLAITDPVEKYLPEFKNQWLIKSRNKGELTLKNPSRPITIKDLLTHTSGLQNLRPTRNDHTLSELTMAYSKTPLNFEPGSYWSYSNSGINTLGRIIEVVSGLSYAEYMQKKIFNPCGMSDSTFWPSEDQASRVASIYSIDEKKKLKELKEFPSFIKFLNGGLSNKSRTAYPAGGLFSTAEDVVAFYQMTLNGGSYKGNQILQKETLDMMTINQTGDLKAGFVEGSCWGLGFSIVQKPIGVTSTLTPGTFGHGGVYGTQSWADPKTKRIMVLMIQREGLKNSDGSEMRAAFQRAATQTYGSD